MIALVVLALAAINVLVSLRRPADGLSLYIALSLIAPNLSLGAVHLSYEVITAVPIAAAVLLTAGPGTITTGHAILWSYVSVLLLATLIAFMWQGAQVSWVGLFGYARFAIILSLALGYLTRHALERVLLAVASVNACAAMIQLVFPQSVGVFYTLYFKESATPLATFLALGRLTRGSGTFPSPVILGGFSLLAAASFYARFLESGLDVRVLTGLAASLIAGIISTTKTTILGLPIVGVLGPLVHVVVAKKRASDEFARAVVRAAATCLMALMMSIALVASLARAGFDIARYVDYLRHPPAALDARYQEGDGFLEGTFSVIWDNPILGVGNTTVANEFMGDSAYAAVLHDTGIVGVVLLGTLWLWALTRAVRRHDTSAVLMVAAASLVGIGMPIFTNLFGAIILTYAAAIADSTRIRSTARAHAGLRAKPRSPFPIRRVQPRPYRRQPQSA